MPLVSNKVLSVIYLDVFIDLLAIGILIPAIPFYIVYLGRDVDLGIGLLQGLGMSSYAVGQLFGSAILGRVSDIFGRRPVLVGAILIQAVFFALTGISNTFLMFVLVRFGSGLFGGTIPIGLAFITDVTNEKERPQYLGLVGAVIGVGFVIGPALGAALATFGFNVAAFVSAGLGGVNFVIALVWLREPPRDDLKEMPVAKESIEMGPVPNEEAKDPAAQSVLPSDGANDPSKATPTLHQEARRRPSAPASSAPQSVAQDSDGNQPHASAMTKSKTVSALEEGDKEGTATGMSVPMRRTERHVSAVLPATEVVHARQKLSRELFLALVVNFVLQFAFTGMTTTFGVLGLDKFGMDAQTLGFIFVGIGLMMVVTNGGLIKPLTKALGSKKVAEIGMFIVTVTLLAHPLMPSLWSLAVISVCMAAGFGLFNPSIQSLFSYLAPPHLRGSVMGLGEASSSLARATAPIIAGPLYDVLQGLPYYTSAGLSALAMFLLVFVPENIKKQGKGAADEPTTRPSVVEDGTGRPVLVGEPDIGTASASAPTVAALPQPPTQPTDHRIEGGEVSGKVTESASDPVPDEGAA